MDPFRAALPAARLARYDHACEHTSTDPMDLYLWSSSVALVMFDDLSHLEVAMRSSMADQLLATYGMQWFRRTDVFDSDTLKLVNTAWRQGVLSQLNAPPDVVHGKLVVSLMFGFWVKILVRGGYYVDSSTNPPTRQRRIYDTLVWKSALRHAFPMLVTLNARESKAPRVRYKPYETVSLTMNTSCGVFLSLVRKDSSGTTVRLSVTQAHKNLLSLAGYVDTGLEDWLRHHSDVPARIAQCPLVDTSQLVL